jgi:hypothetical protein
MKGLVSHAVLFAVASGLALAVWSRDESVVQSADSERVEVWGGSADSISRLEFESPKLKFSLDSQKDEVGRFFVASLEKDEAKLPPSSRDAGAPEPAKRVASRFVAVKAAGELVQKLAPFSAVRRIGPYQPARAEEFGFDKPDGTLKVKVGGTEQALVIGAATPGGQERYARHVASNTIYAVESDLAQNLLSAESRLLERDFHGFGEADVTRLRVTRAGKSRDFVPVPDKKGAFADAATPQQVDQTAGNWLGKVDRLRVAEYVEKPDQPRPPESAVARIEYFGAAKPLGYLELFAVPGEKGNEYLARTEYTRWYVKVTSSLGEQVDQDLASLVK